MGHEERFLTSRLSAGCGLGKETFAGGRHNEEEAPKAAVYMRWRCNAQFSVG
jgi:hypothetical protein